MNHIERFPTASGVGTLGPLRSSLPQENFRQTERDQQCVRNLCQLCPSLVFSLMRNVNANSTTWIQKIVVTMLLPQAMEEDWCGGNRRTGTERKLNHKHPHHASRKVPDIWATTPLEEDTESATPCDSDNFTRRNMNCWFSRCLLMSIDVYSLNTPHYMAVGAVLHARKATGQPLLFQRKHP